MEPKPKQKHMQGTGIQDIKLILKLRHLGRRTDEKKKMNRRMMNLSFQKSEATDWYKTAVSD